MPCSLDLPLGRRKLRVTFSVILMDLGTIIPKVTLSMYPFPTSSMHSYSLVRKKSLQLFTLNCMSLSWSARKRLRTFSFIQREGS